MSGKLTKLEVNKLTKTNSSIVTAHGNTYCTWRISDWKKIAYTDKRAASMWLKAQQATNLYIYKNTFSTSFISLADFWQSKTSLKSNWEYAMDKQLHIGWRSFQHLVVRVTLNFFLSTLFWRPQVNKRIITLCPQWKEM